ncbi:response regulator transcription factor [Pseudogracilibacillus sp. SE30717A]|uniref:response regulator transcription factor n=1 Tax=Pseudogracilibacillus sp. SE30717A TaxID=3098293 RepID=UPI00300E68E6
MREGKILIAEDESNILYLLELFLKKNNYDVVTALNGKDALEKIKEYLPDLVILDIIMPRISGQEVCKYMREDPALMNIPVIYISSLTSKNDIISSLEFGGDDYITKPFDPNEVVARVKAVLRRTRGSKAKSVYPLESFTYQETKILQSMGKGYTNKEIALNLSLTEGTVKVYNHVIYQKLHVKNRTQAIIRAKELKII